MCGIAGVLGPGATTEAAERLIAPLAHRGPDGIRVEVAPEAALAHARLAIIDLEGGWQPITAAGSTLIGNGEIYNYLELAGEFGLEGRLATGSDFEPLLHLYAREGPAAFARLRGMYAFCLLGCDGRDWLVRDPFGIKPLYIRQGEHTLLFASELRSLRPQGVGLEAAETHQLLSLHYLVGDARLGVERMPPGAVWRVEAGQVAERRASLPAIPAAPAVRRPSAPLLDRLDTVLEDSVRVHQRSDVPYGLFLSGGIDSAAIATLMARLNSRPVTAYTCGFDAPDVASGGAADERRAAERVARALDLDWRETTFTAEDFRRLAPQVAAALDDPTCDYACLPTLKLAEAAKGTLTVVLTGEGGDELFAGYGRYRRALRPWWLGGRPAGPRYDAALSWMGIGDAAGRSRARVSDAAPQGVLDAWAAAVERRPPPHGRLSRLKAAQWGDIATWLPDDLLLKLDRMLMAHGLEGRTPFLDREVAAFAWGLPQGELVTGRFGKRILRRWLARTCPAAQPWTRKQGFTVPVSAWIGPDAAGIGARIAAGGWLDPVVHPDRLRATFDSEGPGDQWPMVFTALWTAIHRDGLAPTEAGAAILG